MEALAQQISSLLEAYPYEDARWGVLVYSLDRSDTLFAHQPDAALAPASNLKLLTTAAALEELGPDFRFRTYLLTDGAVEGGTLRGDLVLYGTGDPGISDRLHPTRYAVFDSLLADLAEAGIQRIEGDLVGDASFLPGPLRPSGWDPRDLNDHFAAPISALSFNENVVSLRVEAASSVGARPTVHTLPDHAGLQVRNDATTVGGRGRVHIDREDPLGPIEITGEIQRGGRDQWRQMTVSDPAGYTMSVFAAYLEEHGIDVSGGVRLVTDPAGSVVGGRPLTVPTRDDRPRTRILARHVSPPLSDYLAVVNKKSHNLFAELTFRVVGRAAEGTGSPEAAARAVTRVLEDLGVRDTTLVVLDGSGLSAGNRVSAGAFVSLMRGMAESPRWDAFWASLPQAGTRGELTRMYQSAAEGNLRAKTGTIENVSALSGMVRSAEGERLAFSIIVNDSPSTGRAKGIENAIGRSLAEFTR